MRKTSAAVILVTCTLAACGSSPSGDCDNFISVECNKLFQCAQSAAIMQYGTESGCEAKLQQQFSCSTWMCPAGQSYDGSQVEACISALNNESCGAGSMTPMQCMNLGPACK